MSPQSAFKLTTEELGSWHDATSIFSQLPKLGPIVGGAAVFVITDALDIVGMVGMSVVGGIVGTAHPTPTIAEIFSPDARQRRLNEML